MYMHRLFGYGLIQQLNMNPLARGHRQVILAGNFAMPGFLGWGGLASPNISDDAVDTNLSCQSRGGGTYP